jgi:DNA-binding beta-propeller fold protein YncE
MTKRINGVVGAAVAAVACIGMMAATGVEAAESLVETRTIGGPGRAEIYPSGVAVGMDGSIIVADTGNDVVTAYSSAGDILWSVGETGDGVGQFEEPRDADVDDEGNIFISDNTNRRMVKLSPDGDWITSWRGPVGDVLAYTPMGIAVRDGKVYIAESGGKRVRVWNTALDTQVLSIESQGECVLGNVRDVDADSAGNIYIANYPLEEVLVFSPTGSCLAKWSAGGVYGIRIAFDPILGRELVFVGKGDPGIQVHETDGTFIAVMGGQDAFPENWNDPASDLTPGLFTGLRFHTVSARR